jgi:hypothetical protein
LEELRQDAGRRRQRFRIHLGGFGTKYAVLTGLMIRVWKERVNNAF